MISLESMERLFRNRQLQGTESTGKLADRKWKNTKRDEVVPLMNLKFIYLRIKVREFCLFVAAPNLNPLPAKTPRVKGPGAWAQQRNGNAEAGQQNTDPWILIV